MLRAIAGACRQAEGQPILELGAGLGALTYYLLQGHGPVLAIERDRDLVPVLRQALGDAANLEVREADAAQMNYGALASELGGSLVVVGNLPYQLQSRILVSVAEAPQSIVRAVFLLQREVAQRLIAKPGGRTYGLLSVLVQRTFQVETLRTVPPEAFHPRPKVHSMVVRLEAAAQQRSPEVNQVIAATARAGFSARRKTLRNALAGGLGASPSTVEAVVEQVGLSPKARAETLSLRDFESLGQALRANGLLRL